MVTERVRHAIIGVVTLLALSVGGYIVLALFSGQSPGPGVLFTSPGSIIAIQTTGDVTVAVLGISITVVAIIVELAANRYTPRISELFVRDPINQVVMSGFVVASVVVLWIGMSIGAHPNPAPLAFTALALITTALVTILPYFAYVFEFLGPTAVVRRIADRGRAAIHQTKTPKRVPGQRTRLRESVEQLGDLATKALENRDKSIVFTCLAALEDLVVEHLQHKGKIPSEWFEVDGDLMEDTDFVALDPSTLQRVARRRCWVELKVLRQFQSLMGDSLNEMRDVAHLVAVHTRRITLAALDANDVDAARLAMKFLNTYQRAALNAKDVRTAFHLMHEYRMLAESTLQRNRPELVVEMAGYIKFYGQSAFQAQIPFLLETAAHDLCVLIERTHLLGAACQDDLLTVLLDVDREPDGTRAQETSLRGVRRAQVKLATWYLHHERKDLAGRIAQDLRAESPKRLAAIRADLEKVTEEEFHEVSDRGVHFDWLPPERRALLADFFAMVAA